MVAVVAVVGVVVDDLILEHTQLIVSHVATACVACLTNLQIECQIMMRTIVILPTSLAYVRTVAGETLTITLRGSDVIIHNGFLLLLEVALILDRRHRFAHIPQVLALAVVQLRIHAPSAACASRRVHHAAPTIAGATLGGNVDDAHIAIGTIARRGGSDELNILDGSCRYLLQSLCASERTQFAIYIHQEVAASAEGHAPIGIHLHRRRVGQDIHSRATRGRHRRRTADALTIQFIYYLILFTCHRHLTQACGQHLQAYGAQIDGLTITQRQLVAHVGVVAHQAHQQ